MTRRAFSVLLLLAFLDSAAFGVVYPLFSTMLFDPQWHFVAPETTATIRGFWLGVFISATPLVAMLVSPIIGNLSDTIGRRPVIIFCLFCGALSWLAAALSVAEHSLYGIALARVTMGISVASFGVANACIADISADQEKGRRYAWMGMAFGAGYAIGPLMGGVFAGETAFWSESLIRPFLVSTGCTMANTLFIFLWLPETLSTPIAHQSRRLFAKFREIAQLDSHVLSLLTATFLFVFGWSFYIDFIPAWWVEKFHMTTTDVSLFYGYGALWYVMSCGFLVRPMLRRHNPLSIFFAAACALSACIWVLLIVNTPTTYWWILPLQNIAASFLFPVAATAISIAAPKDHLGKIMGYHTSAETLGFGIGPLTAGPFLGLHLLMPVAIGGLAVLGAGVVAARLKQRLRR